MNLLNQSAFLKALGWALLDSVWQMGLLWLLYVVLTANGKKLQARQRHTIALLSLTGGTLWFVITLIRYCYKLAEEPAIISFYLNDADAALPASSFTQQLYGWLDPSLAILSTTYLVAVLFLFIRLYRQYRITQKLFTEGLQKANPEWRAFLQQAAGHMGIKKNVQVWLSSLVDTPLTIGFWKPVILLPVAAVTQLNLQQAEAIILHELNHIRRNDYLVNLLVACVDVILFFNPFARLITNTIRREREHSCDDMVMQFRYDAGMYARALVVLEQNRLALPQLAIAATGSNQYLLLNRVKRLLTNEPVTAPFQQKMIAFLLSAVLIGFIGWYNPGKVIIQTIREVNTPGTAVTNTENTAIAFATPAENKIRPTRVILKQLPNAVDSIMVATPLVAIQQAVTANAYEQAMTQYQQKMAEYEVIMQKAKREAEIAFVQNLEARDFSLPAAPPAPVAPEAPADRVYPFVPANSFSYQPIEDTSNPKEYIQTFSDQQAKMAMEKAMMALQEIDWQKMEKALNAKGKKVDMIQLQKQLKQAMADVNWKKINEEAQASLKVAMDENVANRQDLERVQIQLQRFQQQHAVQVEKMKKAQQQVLMDRLHEREAIIHQKVEDARKQADSVQRKKIVVI
ncbi:MAG: M56 family metallopeptidase [Chitinophagaceae bacterium]